MSKRTAIIDIGSNSVSMVIYEKTSRFAFNLIYESKSKVRLSQDAYKNDENLQKIPMQRTFDALSDYMKVIASLKAKKTLCVATSALRDAPNKKEFLKKVSDKLGLKIKIIDGQKEAYLGGIACANLLPTQENALTIDIGGGSTEFAFINQKNIEETISLNLGTLRLKELFFDNANEKEAIKYIDEKLQKLNTITSNKLVGIGGTMRALSTAIMQEVDFPLIKLHAFESDAKRYKNFIDKILVADEKELLKLGIKENRLDVIKTGSIILQRVIKKLSISEIITSGVGVKEGLYLSDLLRHAKDKLPANYNPSVRNILDLYVDDKNYSNNLSKLSKILFDLLQDKLHLATEHRASLSTGALLYPAGSSIHQFSLNKHSYYLLQSSLEYGFTQKQIVLISTLVRYAKRKLPSQMHVDKYAILLPKRETLDALSYILSLSIALLSHRPRNIDFTLTLKDNTIHVTTKDKLYLTQEAIKTLEPLKNLWVKLLQV